MNYNCRSVNAFPRFVLAFQIAILVRLLPDLPKLHPPPAEAPASICRLRWPILFQRVQLGRVEGRLAPKESPSLQIANRSMLSRPKGRRPCQCAFCDGQCPLHGLCMPSLHDTYRTILHTYSTILYYTLLSTTLFGSGRCLPYLDTLPYAKAQYIRHLPML